jgi:hypothetical protein
MARRRNGGQEEYEMAEHHEEVRGVKVGGREPKALLLTDGTRLALESDGAPGEVASWTRVGDDEGQPLSVTDAMALAGEEYAEYVQVRTRAEAAWLELISEWYQLAAERLRGDLDQSTPAYAGSFD